ncbi:hypothetical protein D6810_03305, partial [Candidatus Dojkabacteria bacterium]
MPKILEIFPKVYAQEISATAQPTWGSIPEQGPSLQSSSITLSSNKTSLSIGETVKVSIEIKTNNNQINEFRIFLSFDPSKLSVKDQDNQTPGTQILLLDQLFTVQTPAEDNVVNGGEIKLIAKTQSGNGFQVNRIVAEVEFQAQSTGTTTVQVVQGSGKSALVRPNGTTLNFSTNSQILTLTSIQSPIENLPPEENGESEEDIVITPPPSKIPDTSL